MKTELNKINKKKLITGIIIVIAVVGGFFLLNDSLSKISNEKALKMLEKVIVLPDEEPTITTITDASGLRTQDAFYKNTKDGDLIFLYMNNRKIIIYRPNENKIINVGPILDDVPQNQ